MIQKLGLAELSRSMMGPWSSKDIVRTGQGVFRFRVMENTEAQWHTHQNGDEVFIVVSGILEIDSENGIHEVAPGELALVPKGVKHRARARGRVEVLVYEETA